MKIYSAVSPSSSRTPYFPILHSALHCKVVLLHWYVSVQQFDKVLSQLSSSHRTQARTGGQILAFQAGISNSGPGIIQPRNEAEAYGTAKERSLWEPIDIVWRNLAEECADAGVAVNVWLFPDQWIDVGTIGSSSAHHFPKPLFFV